MADSRDRIFRRPRNGVCEENGNGPIDAIGLDAISLQEDRMNQELRNTTLNAGFALGDCTVCLVSAQGTGRSVTGTGSAHPEGRA